MRQEEPGTPPIEDQDSSWVGKPIGVGVGGADLTIGIGHLPIFVEVGEEQAVDEGGFPEA